MQCSVERRDAREIGQHVAASRKMRAKGTASAVDPVTTYSLPALQASKIHCDVLACVLGARKQAGTDVPNAQYYES